MFEKLIEAVNGESSRTLSIPEGIVTVARGIENAANALNGFGTNSNEWHAQWHMKEAAKHLRDAAGRLM